MTKDNGRSEAPAAGVLIGSEIAPFNPVFWAALLASWTVITFLHSRKIYPAPDLSFWLAFSSGELRALLAMGLAILIGDMLKRPLGRFGELLPAALLLLLTELHQAAAFTFFYLDQPLSAVFGYLSSGENMGLWAMLANVGASDRALVGFLAAAAALAALGFAFLVFSARRAARKDRRIRTARLVGFCYAAALLIFLEQVASRRVKNPAAWSREQLTSPLYAAILSPSGFETYAAVMTPRRDPASARLPDEPAAARKPASALLIVLESFRGDCIDPETTPNLYRFKKENLSFPRAFSNGNATALSWPAIVESSYPLYANPGSPALALLQKAGFRNSVYASKGIEYFNFRSQAFGPGDGLAKVFVEPGLYDPESDLLSTRRMLRDVADRPAAGRDFRILFLNATHAPYRWPADYGAKYRPFLSLGTADHGAFVQDATTGTTGGRFSDAREAVVRFHNRYKNSVNYVDSLFGSIVSDLKARGLYEKAVIVVVGDHGQEFMEHGALTHGNNLFNPQIRIPLIMKLPGIRKIPASAPASQVDIMPTLLDYFGLGRAARSALVGRSLLRDQKQDRAVLTLGVGTSDPTMQRYALSTGKYKIEFEMPKARGVLPLVVLRVSDADDHPFVPGNGTPAAYRAFLDREFAPRLNELGAISIVGRITGM